MARTFWLDETFHDVRYGIRALANRPGFALMTASSLAVGIAAVTIVLGVVDSLLLRPLPVRDPAALVVIGASNKSTGSLVAKIVSMPTVRDLQARTDLFQGVAASQINLVVVRRPGAPLGERRVLTSVTGNYFSVLGITATEGRALQPDDEIRRERAIVLTDRGRRRYFPGQGAAIGSTLLLNGAPFTVVGVMDPEFTGTDHVLEPDGFIPVTTVEAIDPTVRGQMERREFGSFVVVARRQNGIALSNVTGALVGLSRQLRETFPAVGDGFELHAVAESRARPTLEAANSALTVQAIFSGLAVLVLLTACVNATNLILAYGSTRQTEFVVRQALGASRSRLVRQIVTQNLIVALLALAIAWLAASLAIQWLTRLPLATDLPLTWGIVLNRRVFTMALVVAVTVGLVAGLGPALMASRFDLQQGIREGGRGASRGGQRLRSVLVIGQIAATLVVLVCAGFLTVSMRQAGRIDLGFEPRGVVTFGVAAAQSGAGAGRPSLDRLRRELASLPGARGAATTNSIPMTGNAGGFADVYLDGEASSNLTQRGAISMFNSAVGPGFFEVIGMPILQGRAFTERDDSSRTRVAIVNRRAADVLWPGKSPLGRIIRLGRDTTPVEIIGVAKNSRYILIGEDQRPYLYLALNQQAPASTYLVIKTAGDPRALASGMRAAVASIDPDLVPYDVFPMDDLLQNSPNALLPLRIGAVFASGVGLLAVFLTTMGLYGLIAFMVTQRTREIGLRMALGADRWTVVRSILGQGGRLAGIGIGLGLVGAFGVTRALGSLLIGVRVTDVSVFAAVAVGLAVVTLASALVPARRASRIDPVTALNKDG